MSLQFPFRLVAFDLDDTLLLPSGELSERAVAALERLHEHGIVVALASGRMLANMTPVAERLNFAPAIVSFNGAQVNLSAEHEPLYLRPVAPALAERVIDFAFERNLHLHFYHDNHLYTNRIDDWEARVYREQTGATLLFEPHFDRLRGLPATKMLIADTPDRVAELKDECSQLFGPELTITRSKPIYLEFLHPEVDKGVGFAALCQHLDIPLAQTVAFGDSYNDIEMLRAAGTAVAVDNALSEVKAVADQICATNAEDGVAQWIETAFAQNSHRENLR
jgi:Cof subfamily protein (haloacid dehalogenase superfamily)